MGLSEVQIAIAVGWGARGLALAGVSLGLLLRPWCAQTRGLAVAFFILVSSYFGSLAEYTGLGLRYARLTELTVASFLVALLYGAIFKLDPPSLLFGVLALVGSNLLYVFAAETTNSQVEAGMLVIGAVMAIVALLVIGTARLRRDLLDWLLVVGGAAFYLTVLIQTIFGPWVQNTWNFTTWIIIWEVAISLFYGLLAVGAWFSYVPGTLDNAYDSDWFDMIAYVLLTNRWAEPPRKVAD